MAFARPDPRSLQRRNHLVSDTSHRLQGNAALWLHNLVYVEASQNQTNESVELATLEWVPWSNNHRLLEPIGYIPTAESEENYFRQLASQAITMAARLKPISLHETELTPRSWMVTIPPRMKDDR